MNKALVREFRGIVMVSGLNEPGEQRFGHNGKKIKGNAQNKNDISQQKERGGTKIKYFRRLNKCFS